MSERIIAGTGHRPDKLGGYGQEARAALVRLAVQGLHETKATKLITGMALGWDTALAVAAHTMLLPYIAAVPFEGQENRWPEESRELYRFLLSHAEKTVVVCEGGYAPWKMQKRNEWMVDNCDTVLALWNGSKGGTANCVAFAEKTGVYVHNMWDTYNKENLINAQSNCRCCTCSIHGSLCNN